jgi:exonuclease III
MKDQRPDEACPDRCAPLPNYIYKTTREFTVSTYNVRTLSDSTSVSGLPIIGHKLQQIVAGCEKHHIDIISLQEHRLTIDDGEEINFIDLNGWTLAHTNSCHRSHGVAILFSKRIAQVLINVECKSDRIIAAHLQGNPRVCIISAYAPTETGDEKVKDNFYKDLEDLILSLPPHTVVITAGDFNARIGKDSHESTPKIVGPNCYHEATNRNGQRMIDLCEAANLRPAHSHFEHRMSRLCTFQPPDSKLPPNQIDHILINTKWWKSITNCRAYNTIDIGSDHRIVSANFRLSLRASERQPNDRCKFNSEKLEDQEVSERFNIDLTNRFNALLDEAALSKFCKIKQIQMRTDALDKALIESSKAILGKRQRRKQPNWVSVQTLKLLDAQESAKTRYKERPSPARKHLWQESRAKVSASFERDQAANLDAQLIELELASRKRELGNVWKIVNHISAPPKPAVKVRKLDGSLPQNKEELVSEWRNYFNTLLNNKSESAKGANRPLPAPDNREISTAIISRAEVFQAIKSLRRGKAPGPDFAMTAEVLKDGGNLIVDQLHHICKLVFEECHAPPQWTSSLIIPLPKKGNLQLMTNYRGISLMSIAAKVYNRILLNRIRTPIDKMLRKNQAGFRTGRSCIQQIHILRRIMDGAFSDAIPLFVTFIDFKKAFDSIDRDMMFAILRHYGIPQKIVSAIRVLYDDSKSRVYVDGQLSEPFDISTGVLQGDVLAPFLFIIVIDYVSKLSAGEFGYLTHAGSSTNSSGRSVRSTTRMIERRVNDLAFADDIALLENDASRAQGQLDALRTQAASVGLEINIKKTEQMRLNLQTDCTPPPLLIDNQPIEVVEEFKYLGSYMGSTDKDISARIALAKTAFAKLRPILSSRNGKPSLSLKIRLFNAACVSILLYGCESWVLSTLQAHKLDAFARLCYRIILGINQSETHTTNDQLYAIVNARPITSTIRDRQLQFTGHCLRMPEDEPSKIFVLYTSSLQQTHRRGPSRRSYLDQISTYLSSERGLSAVQILHYAKDKPGWAKCISAPKKPDR